MRLVQIVLVIGCVGLLGCPSGSTQTDGGVVAAGDAGQVGGIDAGTRDSGLSPGDGGTVVSGALKQGQIEMSQSATSAVVSASFSISNAIDRCTVTVAGACTIRRCVDGSDGGTVSVHTAEAGMLTITGTLLDAGLALVNRGGFDGYSAAYLDPLWAGGETLTASGTGGDVPAFSGQSVVAPSAISVSAPVCPNDQCGSLSRAVPLAVTWSGGASGTVLVTLAAGTSTPRASVSIECGYPASAGSAMVPAAVISEMQPYLSGSVTVENTATKSFTAGEFAITFTARAAGVSGSATFH